jgi:LysM repeat protein
MKKWRLLIPTLVALSLLFILIPGVSADTTYVVKPGENLFRIALNHGLTTQELAAYNGILNPTRIYAGQTLLIPDKNSTAPAPAPAEAPVAPQATDSGGQVNHLVKRGEILSGIALQYGVSVQAISQANGIYNPSLIYAGQTLVIPGSSTTTASEPAAAPAAAPAPVSYGNRWIDVNLTNQQLTAYENNTPVYHAVISSGRWPYLTVTGQFQIYTRYQSQDMNGYRLGYDYYLPNVPYVQYFYRDYAIHGTYWHNNFGTPMSHGCVNLTIPDSQWVFNWASNGTVVNVHY